MCPPSPWSIVLTTSYGVRRDKPANPSVVVSQMRVNVAVRGASDTAANCPDTHGSRVWCQWKRQTIVLTRKSISVYVLSLQMPLAGGVMLILAVIGLHICLSVISGTWAFRRSVNHTMDAGIATVIDSLDLTTAESHQVDAAFAEAQTAMEDLAQLAQQGQIDPNLAPEFAARFQPLGELVGELQGSLDAFASAVDVVDLVPVVDAGPLVQRFQAVMDGLARTQRGITDVHAAIAQGDNPRITTRATDTAGAIAGTRTALTGVQTDIDATRLTLMHAQQWLPRWTLIGALAVTLLFALLAAGQISLLVHAQRWMRRRRKRAKSGAQRASGKTPEKLPARPASRAPVLAER